MRTRARLFALGTLVLVAAGCGAPDSRESSTAVTRQGLVTAPDFVVAEVKAPVSTTPGQGFTAQVRVCNQGTQSGSTDVELYLSADTTIRAYDPSQPPEDARVGFGYTRWLVPGQCEVVHMQGSANPPPPSPPAAPLSAWYVGAVVDPTGGSFELDESNNAKAGPQMGIGYAPDFIVTSVTGPASATAGQSFTAQVKVCNQGTQSGSTDVELYLSADATIRPYDPNSPQPPEDARVGTGYANWLAPGQCETVYVQAGATPPPYSPPPGGAPLSAWYVGAAVNTAPYNFELNRDNNTLAGTRMGIGYGPDFVVTEVTSPASATPGQGFTAQVRVCNQGTQSGSTEVELYLSADATISPYDYNSPLPPEDARVGSGYTRPLAPGQCEVVYVQASANPPPQSPPPGGAPLSAWYVGAVVNTTSYNFELNRDNNTLAGTRMGIGYGPDFIVTSVTGPASANPGQSFTAQARVCNQGTQGGSTYVDLYLSADATIRPYDYNSPLPPEDALVGTGYTRPLAPGQCETVYVQASANPPPQSPPPSGAPLSAWYVGAAVNTASYNFELNRDNNTLAGTRMGVGSGPDFVVTEVTAPASATSGQSFTAQVRVCNQGTQSGSTDLELYLSADATISPYDYNSQLPPEDARVGSGYTRPLAPGQCETVYVQAGANPPPQSPPPGGAPLSTWYVGAAVNTTPMNFELNRDNNTLAGTRMGVGSGPDFVVTEVTSPASATAGQSFTAQVRVCNQGTQSGSTEVELYLSADATISPYDYNSPQPPEDSRVGSGYTRPLAPGQCEVVYVDASANPPPQSPPPSGAPLSAWYVGAVVNTTSYNFELNRDNNTLAGTRMGIGYGPDFIVTSVTGPASATPGQSFTAQARVCNQGTQSGSTYVDLYLSADATISPYDYNSPLSPEDALVGTGYTRPLAPGQCETVYVQASANPPPQWPPPSGAPLSAWYVGAAVNTASYNFELNRDNNTLAGARMGIGSGPDFVVTEVTAPASATSGQSFTAQVKVCNQGTQSGSTDLELYLSADATISPYDYNSPQPPEDARVGSGYTRPLAPGQCEVVYVPASATPPPQSPPPNGAPLSTWYVGAVVNPTPTNFELNRDNNALAGTRMGVGNGPDFVVTEVMAPASTPAWQSFTAQVRVCNQGTQGGSTDLELYLSADATISPYDYNSPLPPEDALVGTGYTRPLVPGQCEVVYVDASANPPPQWPPPSGAPLSAWYVGAAVNTASYNFELNRDNNTLAGARMGIGSGPDFVVTEVTAPASATSGQSFTAQVRVCNQGTQSGSTDLELYLSADTTIRPYDYNSPLPPEDAAVGSASSGALQPGQCQVVQVSASANPPPPPIGAPLSAWYVGAVADPSRASTELNEDNNTLAGTRMGVGSQADFIITSVTGPGSAMPGQSFTAQVRVCNQGTQSGGTDLELYLSADATIRPYDPISPWPPEDARVGYASTGVLQPGECQVLPVSADANPPPPPPAPPGVPGGGPLSAWYLGAVVNPFGTASELNRDNNTLAGTLVSVTP